MTTSTPPPPSEDAFTKLADEISNSELAKLSAELGDEVAAAFASDRWAILRTEAGFSHLHAAAGLSHCLYLLRETIHAHDRHAEMTGRLTARAFFETWLVAYYISLGGVHAVERVDASYTHSLTKQHDAIARRNAEIRARRRRVRKRNRAIRKTNEQLTSWNSLNPDMPAKELHDELPMPPGEAVDFDLTDRLASTTTDSAPLPYTEIVVELRRLTRERGREETFDDAYNLAYRGLSSLGAHANLFVLNSYLDDRDGNATFIRIREASVVPSSFSEPNQQMCVLLSAVLAQEVLEKRGGEAPVANEIIGRFNQVHAASNASTGT